MARPLVSISDWLGLNKSRAAESDDVPRWNGSSKGLPEAITFIWVAVGVLIFVFIRSEMPAEDGFGGYIPLITAVMLMALGVTFTERLLLKTNPQGDS